MTDVTGLAPPPNAPKDGSSQRNKESTGALPGVPNLNPGEEGEDLPKVAENIVSPIYVQANDVQEYDAEDSDLFDDYGNFDAVCAKAKSFTSYTILQDSLKCPELENNVMFKKLKRNINKFYLEAERVRIHGKTPGIKRVESNTGLDFNYMAKLNQCLKKMLRDVINCTDMKNQEFYLKRTYNWFIQQQSAIGLIGPTESAVENDIMNPQGVLDRASALEERQKEALAELMDPAAQAERFDEMFREEERTEHKHIMPARDRIKQFRVKKPGFKRNMPSAVSQQNLATRLTGAKSTANLATGKSQVGLDARPTTAGVISVNASDATAAQTGIDATSHITAA